MVRATRSLRPLLHLALAALCSSACARNTETDEGNANSAGSGGAPAAGGSAGAAGASAGDTSFDSGVPDPDAGCTDLFAQARQQLDAAAACHVGLDAGQCTGSVGAVCGCDLAVDSASSGATQAYLSTLQGLKDKSCVQNCPAINCVAPHSVQCVPQVGGSGAVCVYR